MSHKNPNVQVFERNERDGWKLILPLEGKRRFDSNLLNPEAAKIFNDLRQGKTPAQIIEATWQKYHDIPYERVKNDVYASIVKLRELGVYEMAESDIKEICSNPTNKLPGLHVMDETEIRPVSQKVRAAYAQDTGKFLFALGKFNIEDMSPIRIRSLHFNAMNTYFVHNNQEGNIDGIVSLVGLGALSPVVPVGILVLFDNDIDRRFKIAVEMLKQLEIFVRSLTHASKLRFMMYRKVETDVDSDESLCSCQQVVSVECDELYPLLEKCGFRHEATLNHEGGQGVHIEYYTKKLVE